MNKNIDEDFAIDLDILETPHGIFTSNTHLGLSAREVYAQYLHELENPTPPKPTLEEVVKEQENKISILEDENIKMKSRIDIVNATHSDLIFDIDFRVMDIEDALGLEPIGINLFNLKGEDDMNITFVMLLDKIESGNYNNREEIESMADRYLARNRISIDEYDILMKALDKKELERNTAEL